MIVILIYGFIVERYGMLMTVAVVEIGIGKRYAVLPFITINAKSIGNIAN